MDRLLHLLRDNRGRPCRGPASGRRGCASPRRPRAPAVRRPAPAHAAPSSSAAGPRPGALQLARPRGRYSTSSQMRGVPSTCGMIFSRKFGVSRTPSRPAHSRAPCACSPSCRWRRAPGRSRACRPAYRSRRCRLGLAQLLGEAPQLAAAGDRRMVVQEHAVRVAALLALERHGDHLAALGVVAEAGGVRHADELVLHQRLFDLERLRHDRAQLVADRCGR